MFGLNPEQGEARQPSSADSGCTPSIHVDHVTHGVAKVAHVAHCSSRDAHGIAHVADITADRHRRRRV